MAVLDLSEDTKLFLAEQLSHRSELEEINRKLNKLITISKETRNIVMATKEELNASLDALTTKVNKIGSDLSAELTRLGDLVAAGSDLTDSLAKVQSIADQLEAIDATLPEQTPAP